MSDYNIYQVMVEGISPLLMHNGAMSSPLHPIAQAMKKITAKRKKVEADYAELAELEFKGGLYVEAGKITLPTLVIEATLVEGAKVHKEGKIALASMFVEPNVEFTYSGPQTITERLADPACRKVAGVRVGQNRVERCRPIFEDWKLKFEVSMMAASTETAMLERWVRSAGTFKGFGDWRPRFGRFSLVSIEQMNAA